MTPTKIARYEQAAAELTEEARVKRELREEKFRLEAVEEEDNRNMEDFTVQGDFTVPMEIDRPTDNETPTSDKGTSKPDRTRSRPSRVSKSYRRIFKPNRLGTMPEEPEMEMESEMEPPVDRPMDTYSELELEDHRWDYEPVQDSVDSTMGQNFADEFNIMLSSSQMENNIYSSIEKEVETNREFMSSTGMDTLEDEDLYSAD